MRREKEPSFVVRFVSIFRKFVVKWIFISPLLSSSVSVFSYVCRSRYRFRKHNKVVKMSCEAIFLSDVNIRNIYFYTIRNFLSPKTCSVYRITKFAPHRNISKIEFSFFFPRNQWDSPNRILTSRRTHQARQTRGPSRIRSGFVQALGSVRGGWHGHQRLWGRL